MKCVPYADDVESPSCGTRLGPWAAVVEPYAATGWYGRPLPPFAPPPPLLPETPGCKSKVGGVG